MVDPAVLLDRLPEGWSEAIYGGRRYGVTRTVRLGGRAQSVLAEELGGDDVVSANLYLDAAGESVLRPCEMPATKVLAFLAGQQPAPGRTTCARARA